jgi:hypothetical protein
MKTKQQTPTTITTTTTTTTKNPAKIYVTQGMLRERIYSCKCLY